MLSKGIALVVAAVVLGGGYLALDGYQQKREKQLALDRAIMERDMERRREMEAEANRLKAEEAEKERAARLELERLKIEE